MSNSLPLDPVSMTASILGSSSEIEIILFNSVAGDSITNLLELTEAAKIPTNEDKSEKQIVKKGTMIKSFAYR